MAKANTRLSHYLISSLKPNWINIHLAWFNIGLAMLSLIFEFLAKVIKKNLAFFVLDLYGIQLPPMFAR